MATASDIIRRALRIIRALDAQEAMEASDAQDALDTLNAMLAEWHEAEIGLPDYSLATLDAELASDAADREAIAGQLGIRLCPEYGQTMTDEARVAAESAMSRLRLRYFQPGTTSFAELPSATTGFNIETGDY